MKYTLSKVKFKKWLSEKKPNKIIGVSKDPENCPLVNYIKSTYPDVDVLLDYLYNYNCFDELKLQLLIDGKIVKIGNWADIFISHVDYTINLDNSYEPAKITAAEALSILKYIDSCDF